MCVYIYIFTHVTYSLKIIHHKCISYRRRDDQLILFWAEHMILEAGKIKRVGSLLVGAEVETGCLLLYLLMCSHLTWVPKHPAV